MNTAKDSAQRTELTRSGQLLGRRRRRSLAAALLAGAVVALSACGSGGGGGGNAENYPDPPITIVVPFAAGGPTDTVTRLIAEPMSKELGQQIVVQNVAGAGGTLAAGEVAAAEPDGYTVLMHHIGMSTAPSLYPDLAYNPLEDFKTIGLVTEVPMTIIARKDFEPTDLEALVDLREGERQDKVTYANAGVGAASQLCGLLFVKRHRHGADRGAV